jgi:GAF domain-containing protein
LSARGARTPSARRTDEAARLEEEARVAALHALTTTLAQALSAEDVARALLRHSLRAVGASAGSVSLIGNDGESLEPVVTTVDEGSGGMPVSISLVASGSEIGILEIVLREGGRPEDPEWKLLLAMANVGAQAMARAKLYEAERTARAEVEKANARLARLQAISDVALAHLDLDELLENLLSRVRSAHRRSHRAPGLS